MQLDLLYLRPRQVVGIERRGPYAQSVGEAWKAMLAWLDAAGVRRTAIHGFGIAWDPPRTTPPEKLRYSACIDASTPAPAEAIAQLAAWQLPGGTYAVHRHKGPYAEKTGKFATLHRDWVPENGLMIDHGRPFVEIYLNDPAVTADIDCRVDLCVPVAAPAAPPRI